jgi:DNA replication licensing factor MCM3
VDERDAMAAEEILRFALFKEVLKAERRKRRKLNNGQPVEGESDEEDEEEDGEQEEEEGAEAGVGPGVTESQRERAREKARRMEGGPKLRGAHGRSREPTAEQPQADEDDVDMDGADAALAVEEEEQSAGELSSDR